jgi:hypothetical protein
MQRVYADIGQAERRKEEQQWRDTVKRLKEAAEIADEELENGSGDLDHLTELRKLTPWGVPYIVEEVAPEILTVGTWENCKINDLMDLNNEFAVKVSPRLNKCIPGFMRHEDGWYGGQRWAKAGVVFADLFEEGCEYINGTATKHAYGVLLWNFPEEFKLWTNKRIFGPYRYGVHYRRRPSLNFKELRL